MKRFTPVGFFLMASILCPGVWAGVKAQMRTDLHQSSQSHVLTGNFYAQGNKIRVDQTLVGLSQSTIIDYFSNKVTVLLHSRKIFVEVNLDDLAWRNLMMRGQIPKPEKLKAKGYRVKFLRDETLDSHPCRVIEVSWEGMDRGSTVLWQAKDLDGVVVKSEASNQNGSRQVTTLYKIQKENLPDTLFLVPTDYARSPESVVGFERSRP